MDKAKRVGGIDFWRGVVLIAIVIDHIPGNLLENLTPRNFGFSDSAEAFVFLSGLSVGMIYLPRAQKRGWAEVARACLQRAGKLYGVHIGLTLAALVIFACAYWLSGLDDMIEAHGRSFVFGEPAEGLVGLALMSLQIGYFNILPLYVALMLWAPLALAIAMRRPAVALAVSLGLYLASRLGGLRLPNWPEPGTWFFNPLAWQLLFTFGLLGAILWCNGPPAASWNNSPFACNRGALRRRRHRCLWPPPRCSGRMVRTARHRQAGSRPCPARSLCRDRLSRRHLSGPGQADGRAAGARSPGAGPQRTRGFRSGFDCQRTRTSVSRGCRWPSLGES